MSLQCKINKNYNYLTEQVRLALARTICKQNLSSTGELITITMSQEVETEIFKGINPDGESLSLNPSFVKQLMDSLNEELQKAIKTTGNQPVILCSSPIRLIFRKLIERTYPQLTIMTYNEVVNNVKAKTIGIIRVGVKK